MPSYTRMISIYCSCGLFERHRVQVAITCYCHYNSLPVYERFASWSCHPFWTLYAPGRLLPLYTMLVAHESFGKTPSLSLSLSLSLFISVIHCPNVTLKWARSATKTLNVKHVCWRQDHKFTTAMHCSEGTGKQQLSIGIGLLSSAELLRLTTANESWITDSVKEWLHENRRNCLERKVVREVQCQEQLFADSRNATCSF